MASILGSTFLQPISPDYFNNPNISSFEFCARIVEKIPVSPVLVPKITRAMFPYCRLQKLPPGLCSYNLKLGINPLWTTPLASLEVLKLTHCSIKSLPGKPPL